MYERFDRAYRAAKDDLAAKGIRSLSGYLSQMLDEALLEDRMAGHPVRLRKIHAEAGRAVEVVVRDGEPFCLLCDRDDCVHAGFVHAIPSFFLKHLHGRRPAGRGRLLKVRRHKRDGERHEHAGRGGPPTLRAAIAL